MNFVIYTGTHWIFEIVSLIVNGGDPSKIDRSRMVTALEVTMANLNMKNVSDSEAISAVPAAYEIVDGWTSPRVIMSHIHERHVPSDIWKRKRKVA